jgi:two-component system response regulator YesN
MTSVIIADDDLLVREILKKSIPWKSLGLSLLAAAENGQEALDMCQEKSPDILLADIRMPGLNGLEVAFRLLEKSVRTRVIFISGIQDFNYARSALNVQAAGYILKPIQLNEVIAALKRVRDAIEIESSREMVLRRMREKLVENIPLARDVFLRNLSLHAQRKDADLGEQLEYFNLPFKHEEEAAAAVLEIDDYHELIRDKSEDEIQLLNFTIKRFIDQVLENYQAGSGCIPRDGEYVIILNGRYSEEHKLSLIIENILELVRGYGGLSVSIGVGSRVQRLDAVHISCHEARCALSNKFFTGPGSIIHFGDITGNRAIKNKIGDEDSGRLKYLHQAIIGQMRLGSEEKITGLFEEFQAAVNGAGSLSREYIRGQFLELVITAYQEFCKTEGEVPGIFESYVGAMRRLFDVETVSEIKDQCLSMMKTVISYFREKYNERSHRSVSRIKDYIIKMRNRNISLADIANEVYMSPSYMCAVFKRETGKTVNEFIIEDKMNHAKDLLRNSRMKIFEIAEHLGYENPHYFSYSFKRFTGLTPQQVRMETGKPLERY